MKINIKYAGLAAVIILSLLLSSCMQETVGPVGKSSTSVQINLSGSLKGVNTPLADAMLNGSNASKRAAKVVNANADTLAIDEVQIILLDMTKYTKWNDFYSKWEATGQYSLIDTSIYGQMGRAGKDEFDIYRAALKSYTGTEYSYIGDYGFSLSGGKSEATFYLNPGLNYYMYAFRSSAKDSTFYLSEGHLTVQENVDNTIQIGKPDYTGSYTGAWTNTNGDTTGSVTLNIYQTATDSIKGTFVMGSFSCFDTLTVTGRIGGYNYLNFNVQGGDYSGYVYMNQDGYDFSGSWYITPSCRSFYNGNMTLQRISTKPNLGKTK
jgi:hypothetical protein